LVPSLSCVSGDTPKIDIGVVPTGSIGIDEALGIGGLPRGRIIEIYGPESSGKTTLTLHVIAEAQKMGGICAFIDAEHAMDPEYATKLGVKINDLLISQPESGEQALDIVESLVRSGKIDVVVSTLLHLLHQKMKSKEKWVHTMLVSKHV
jgi:recombination protein RecA